MLTIQNVADRQKKNTHHCKTKTFFRSAQNLKVFKYIYAQIFYKTENLYIIIIITHIGIYYLIRIYFYLFKDFKTLIQE